MTVPWPAVLRHLSNTFAASTDSIGGTVVQAILTQSQPIATLVLYRRSWASNLI